MKTTIYIAVRGGVVQGVRLDKDRPDDNPNACVQCYVVDYDNYGHAAGADHQDEEAFEREQLDGRTWDEISETSEGVF